MICVQFHTFCQFQFLIGSLESSSYCSKSYIIFKVSIPYRQSRINAIFQQLGHGKRVSIPYRQSRILESTSGKFLSIECFNSLQVVQNPSLVLLLRDDLYSFNSLQVVQNLQLLHTLFVMCTKFQFLIGSLESVLLLFAVYFLLKVSIPYRQSRIPENQLSLFDSVEVSIPYRQSRIEYITEKEKEERFSFNSLQVVQNRLCCLLFKSKLFVFQFLIGSLESNSRIYALLQQIMFQFLIGSLESFFCISFFF